jgi:hypothetical protein
LARSTYIATIQVVIHPDENIKTEAEACDWFSGLLTEQLQGQNKILDWSYLPVGGQFLSPVEKIVSNQDKYEEGDAF